MSNNKTYEFKKIENQAEERLKCALHAVSMLIHVIRTHDLREKSFPVPSVSQGLMAKAPVIVWYIASYRYRVMVRSSFA